MPPRRPLSFADDYEQAVAAQAEEMGAVVTQSNASRERFAGVEPGISVRDSMNGPSRDFFRWGERTPRDKNEKIDACDQFYEHNGIVKLVIDTMVEFVTKGVDCRHPSASKQSRYQHWWKLVNGDHVSHCLVSYLFRHGAACPQRSFAKLNDDDVKHLGSASPSNDLDAADAVFAAGAADLPAELQYVRLDAPTKGMIPLKYTFLNPKTVEPLGGELGMFVGDVRYGLKMSRTLCKQITSPKTTEERRLAAKLPKYIRDAAKSDPALIPLDPSRFDVVFYKKDDWRSWADPIVLAVYKDLILYDRMKEADKAALEGSLSRVRLWRLGLPEHQIVPGKGHFQKLKNQLLAASAGGAVDIIWDAALDFKESSSDLHNFLGPKKYEPVLQAIYAGLGVPQSLTGGTESGGMTNNALSLKTLMERLQYARKALIRFWEGEFERLRLAFGDRHPAQLVFSIMSMSDEAAEKMLWIHLYDRLLLSDQTIQERFGELPDIEVNRIRRENQQRDKRRRGPRQGPFIETAGHPDQLAKTALSQGLLAPSEVGVERQPKEPGDKSLLDHQAKMAKDAAKTKAVENGGGGGGSDAPKSKGTPGQGRPAGSKDKDARKRRTPKVRATTATTASLFQLQIKARADLKVIDKVVTPAFLAERGKKNLRQLTAAEAAELEALKFAHLLAVPPDAKADAKLIAETTPPPSPLQCVETLNELAAEAFTARGVSPSIDEMREMQASAYALIHIEHAEDIHGDPEPLA